MSASFTDVRRLQGMVKSKTPTAEEVVCRAWVYKHKLPASHQLWVGQPFATHLLEFFRDQWQEKSRLEEQLKNPDLSPDLRIKIKEAIDSIYAVLDDGTERSEGDFHRSNDPVSDWLEYKEEVLDKEIDETDLDLSPQEALRLLREHGH